MYFHKGICDFTKNRSPLNPKRVLDKNFLNTQLEHSPSSLAADSSKNLTRMESSLTYKPIPQFVWDNLEAKYVGRVTVPQLLVKGARFTFMEESVKAEGIVTVSADFSGPNLVEPALSLIAVPTTEEVLQFAP